VRRLRLSDSVVPRLMPKASPCHCCCSQPTLAASLLSETAPHRGCCQARVADPNSVWPRIRGSPIVAAKGEKNMSEFKPLNLLDLSFVLMETRQTPMHVAGLQTFVPPPDAPRDFARQLFEYLRSFPVTAAPFTYRLRNLGPGSLLPAFEVVDKVDLDYHLRHSALPYPGGERELGVLVSRLHSNPMDMDRPLWEVHLIEGLHDGRFALYAKLHHSLADGVSGVGLLNFSEKPESSRTPPIWAAERPKRPRSNAAQYGAFGVLPAALLKQARALPSLLQGLAGSAKAAIGLKFDPDFTSLAEAPRTILNTNVTPQRRVATQATTLERMKAIGEAAGGSINDVLLAACSGALRRYLAEIGKLPRKSLVASIPVALPRDAAQADDRRRVDRLHGADQLAADADARAGYRRAGAADLQRHHFQRAGAARQAVFPGCRDGGVLPDLGARARPGAQCHGDELRRRPLLWFHRLSGSRAERAARCGLHG